MTGKPWRTSTIRQFLAQGASLGCGSTGVKSLARPSGNRSSPRRTALASSRRWRTQVIRVGEPHAATCSRVSCVAENANVRSTPPHEPNAAATCACRARSRRMRRDHRYRRPVEELIADAVLYRLDTAELADALAGRAAKDEVVGRCRPTSCRPIRHQLEELSTLYGAKEITAREWMSARKPIEARIHTPERHLARATRSDALAGLIGNGEALRTAWADLNLERQHAIVKAVLDHAVIQPVGIAGRRDFDPGRVRAGLASLTSALTTRPGTRRVPMPQHRAACIPHALPRDQRSSRRHPAPARPAPTQRDPCRSAGP